MRNFELLDGYDRRLCSVCGWSGWIQIAGGRHALVCSWNLLIVVCDGKGGGERRIRSGKGSGRCLACCEVIIREARLMIECGA